MDLIHFCRLSLENIFQIDSSHGAASLFNSLLAPVVRNPTLNSILPVKNILEDVLRKVFFPLLGCDCGDSCEDFDRDVAAYNVYKTYRPGNKDYDYCCRADQFPECFKGISCLSYCLQTKLALEVGQPVCKVLQTVSAVLPLGVIQDTLDAILGPVGSMLVSKSYILKKLITKKRLK